MRSASLASAGRVFCLRQTGILAVDVCVSIVSHLFVFGSWRAGGVLARSQGKCLVCILGSVKTDLHTVKQHWSGSVRLAGGTPGWSVLRSTWTWTRGAALSLLPQPCSGGGVGISPV